MLNLGFIETVRVQNVRLISLNTTSVTLKWDVVPPGKSTVELSTNAIFSSIGFSSGQLSETTYTFTGLAVNTTYFYRVRLQSEAGQYSEYAPNPVGSFTVPIDMNPSLPRRSCLELHQLFPAYSSGTYNLDTDGAGPNAPFQAYCDMTFNDGDTAGGWTLIATYNDNQGIFLHTDTMATVVSPGPNQKAFMAYSRMEPLSKGGQQIAFRQSGSTTHYLISRRGTPQVALLSYAGVGSAVNIFPGMNVASKVDLAWIRGSGVATSQVTATCVPGGEPYPEVVFQTCGNGSGFHFTPLTGIANWNNSVASGINFEVLLR